MVSTTFKNLDNEKKARILDALLNEFSNHTLVDAQVSRIVKESGIARGAFYKYFDDLKDAYEFLYHNALAEIHQKISTDVSKKLKPAEYVEQTRQFVEKSSDSRYYALVKMHILHNENFFISNFNDHLIDENEYFWATQIMIHDAIKQIMIDPKSKEMILKKLSNVLHALAKGEN
ncbi:TetR/AcrR family transcriptional regulator [Companilactobacillus insicii]|uniref:TetR/AcrR family transcriptional regulator n=1 Tax=Companilactobacillus insicii TaxID=1732567 RepID=UPI000F7824CE|nr:TetR/AcrR family transcriptional regulator [Companilactobacillus insicii]